MERLQAAVIFVALLTFNFGLNAMGEEGRKSGTEVGSFAEAAVTTSQTAVFAAFLSNQGPSETLPSGINTAISVSNILAAPPGLHSDFLNLGGSDTTGAVEVYLFGGDGTSYAYSSDSACSAGQGLSGDGTLGPGQTWTFLLADVLDCLGLGRNVGFTGYGWLVGNFDGIAGTYKVTVFDVGFTQSFELTPAVGQGISSAGGLPVWFQTNSN